MNPIQLWVSQEDRTGSYQYDVDRSEIRRGVSGNFSHCLSKPMVCDSPVRQKNLASMGGRIRRLQVVIACGTYQQIWFPPSPAVSFCNANMCPSPVSQNIDPWVWWYKSSYTLLHHQWHHMRLERCTETGRSPVNFMNQRLCKMYHIAMWRGASTN